ncbi:MAG TPA: SusC/RagA family TonB-linked outer membrane protein [Chitinophagaceae bacterium]|nr:SusC/RagA family TonB-linked outer membrane protein [Chitinophagaceae bacterium]
MRKFLTLLMAVVSAISLFAQGQIKGKVTDDTGIPLPGVSVLIKGTKTGTVTASDGSFSINTQKNTVQLEISGTGLISRTVNASVGKDLLVSLTSDIKAIDEVIVTGVAGATSRKKMTVSVTKVGEERLKIVPATSAASALSGKVAGVRINSQGGSPGGSIDVLLRGDNNLNVGSGPLILVDGVILNGSLTDINVDDVESMEVVKGAAAASLYGSRAGNGVIAIITKSGNKINIGTTAVTIRNEVGFQNLQKYIDLSESHAYTLASDWQSQSQYTKFQGVTYPANYPGGFYPGLAGSRSIDADHYMDNLFAVNIDQQKEFFNTGTNYTNFVGIQTRSTLTNMYASFENNSQEGIIQYTNGYKRQNFRLNIDHQVAPWLKFSARNLFINTKTQFPGDGGGIFFNIVLAEPDNNLKLANPDGQPFLIRHNPFSNERNPLYSIWKNQRTDFTRRWIGNYSANIKLAKWINVDLTHTIEIENYRYTNYSPYDTWIVANGGTEPTWGMSYSEGSLYKYSDETNSQNTQATINMNHKFGDLRVQGKLSYLFENKHYENFDVSASQFSYPNIPDFNNFLPTNPHSYSSGLQDTRARNYFAILGLDYKDKFLFDGMGRYDGSSLFGSEERWHPYYRLSGAYRISQDVKIKGIDELKIRAAYGTAGIRPGYDWQYRYYSLSSGNASASQQGNINLKPSNTAELEFGLNVEFLGKFYFEGTYAKSKTTDAFLEVPLIPFLNDGYNRQWRNAAELESNTLELTLGANWFKKRDFTWNTNIVFSKTNQKISRLDVAPYLSGPDGLFYIKEGEKYGAIYGYDWVRTLDQMAQQLPTGKTIADYEVNSDGYVVAAGSQGTINEKPIKLLDADKNLAFAPIGNGNPDFTMGISNTINFKGFQLYFLVDIKKGGDVYNRKSQWLTRDNRNGIEDMANVAAAQKKTLDYFQGFYDVNTNNKYWVEDAGYIKLREVALGYVLPKSALSVFKGVVKGITARIIGRNLLTITDYSGYDPEVGSIRNPFDGTDRYPNFRNLAFSLQLDF